MNDDRKSGTALIAGSLGGILTMAIHPTGGGSLNADHLAHLSLVSGIAHSVAILSFILMFLGACGLMRRLAAFARKPNPDHLAFAGVVTFGFSCVAILIAATISGFIVPSILRHMVSDGAALTPQNHSIVDAVFQFNQAFSRLYSVGTSLAMALWSASALRNGGLGRGIAYYGCVIAALVTAGIVVGHLRLDVHGMAAVVLGQAIWFIGTGVQLYRSDDRGSQPAPVADQPGI
ncbi:MAG TPA: hypothetical protein VGS07_33045 [Thermoanaerobaculia bacterium]|jgi:hypothetical protein|nr:hypothetical protein [Thermoanaerobaculia bacterium]